jgi:L-lysine 2,3-aminomutase
LHNARNRKRVLGFHLKQSTQNCAHCFRRSQVSRNTVN